MTRLAVLDLDGTLLDTLDDLAASVNAALQAVGRPPRPRHEIERFVGDGARRLLERAVAPHDELAGPALAAWWRHYDVHCLDRTRPFAGLPELLTRSGRRLAVHTNKPGRVARRILAGTGLLERFAVVTGGDEGPRKPDPAGTLEIMRRLGARPEDTVFIGAGCSIGSPSMPTTISARRIHVSEGVTTYGTIWAHHEGVVAARTPNGA
jgi:phosphoglycolate phosphatase